ncbi:MAG: hypothetical protein IIB15_04175, partial [Chloroflexi bacterium]|nr:hypothetical protein [Chloroflexota bacterium]
MLYKIWGTHLIPGPVQTVTRQYVTGVQISLQAGDDSAARIDTAARTLNTPEVLSAFWELDFDGDPRTVDTNGDATGDWDEWEGSFSPGMLTDGIWYSPQIASPNRVMLNTVPDEEFIELTTVEVRMRATAVCSSGPYVWVNADRSGNNCAPVKALLTKLNDNTQTLWVGDRAQWFPETYT